MPIGHFHRKVSDTTVGITSANGELFFIKNILEFLILLWLIVKQLKSLPAKVTLPVDQEYRFYQPQSLSEKGHSHALPFWGSGGVNARLFLFHYRCYFPLIFRRQTNKQRKSAKNSQSWKMAAEKKTNRKRKSPLQGALQTKLQNFGAYSSLSFWANCFLLMPKRENKTLSASPLSDFWLRRGCGRGLWREQGH